MDYDQDGILDFISGCYDPGDLYLFRGLGKGKFAAVEPLVDRAGVPLVHHPVEIQEFHRMQKDGKGNDREAISFRVASFGSWPSMVDWDGDGDLDVLIGSFRGEVYLRRNEGTRQAPSWAEASTRLEAGGQPIQVYSHADPVTADWDGDGLWDLVLGSGDGSVGWHRNLGSKTEPRFGQRCELVAAKSKDKFLSQYLEPGQEPSPGVRAQICVTDYDGDGRLDLLVGDYSSLVPLRALDAAERAAFAALVREAAELGTAKGANDEESKAKRTAIDTKKKA